MLYIKCVLCAADTLRWILISEVWVPHCQPFYHPFAGTLPAPTTVPQDRGWIPKTSARYGDSMNSSERMNLSEIHLMVAWISHSRTRAWFRQFFWSKEGDQSLEARESFSLEYFQHILRPSATPISRIFLHFSVPTNVVLMKSTLCVTKIKAACFNLRRNADMRFWPSYEFNNLRPLKGTQTCDIPNLLNMFIYPSYNYCPLHDKHLDSQNKFIILWLLTVMGVISSHIHCLRMLYAYGMKSSVVSTGLACFWGCGGKDCVN